MIRRGWRHADGWADRITGLVLVVVVPLFMWASATGQAGVAVWSVSSLRELRRRRRELDDLTSRFRPAVDEVRGEDRPGDG